MSKEFSALKKIAIAAAKRIKSNAAITTSGETHLVWVSFNLQSSNECAPVQVALENVSDLLNQTGEKAKDKNLGDAQYVAQRRGTTQKNSPDTEYSGITAELDEKPNVDILSFIMQSGLPITNHVFETTRGFRLLWFFPEPISENDHTRIARIIFTALPGCDPAFIENPAQPNRLPTCIKTGTPTGDVTVKFKARLTNAVPTLVEDFYKVFPRRLEHILCGTRCLSPEQRSILETHIGDLGVTLPDAGGATRTEVCPLTSHPKSCCYWNRDSAEALSVNCLAEHGGVAGRYWSELTLYQHFTGETIEDNHSTRIENLPVVPGSEKLVRQRLSSAFPSKLKYRDELISSGIKVWLFWNAFRCFDQVNKKAAKIVDQNGIHDAPAVSLDDLVGMFNERLHGIDRTGPAVVYFDSFKNELRRMTASFTTYSLNFSKKKLLNGTEHQHEMASIAASEYKAFVTTSHGKNPQPKLIVGESPIFARESHLNKAFVGDPAHLRVLGIPSVKLYSFPAAFVPTEEWSINPSTGCIEAQISPALPTAEEGHEILESEIDKALSEAGKDRSFIADIENDCDAVKLFLTWNRTQRLPYVADQDARRAVMLLAAPLVRHMFPGGIGIIWPTGGVGSGKGRTTDMGEFVWEKVGNGNARVAFDFLGVGEEERRKSFEMAGDALYCRNQEGGKDLDVPALIRLSTQRSISVRGLHKDEKDIPNTFVWAISSVEPPLEMQELDRRTVYIRTQETPNQLDNQRDIVPLAPAIISSLKHHVESRGLENLLSFKNVTKRPKGQVVLAEILGITLDPIRKKPLDEIWAAMLAYTVGNLREGEKYKEQAANYKTDNDAKMFPSFSLGQFVGFLRQTPQYQHICGANKKADFIIALLNREADYADVKDDRTTHLRAEAGGAVYAMKFVKDETRFIFVKEDEYKRKRNITVVPDDTEPAKDDIKPPTKVRNTEAENQGSEMSFDDEDLLKNG